MNRLLTKRLIYPLYERATGRRVLHKWHRLEASQWLPRAQVEAEARQRLGALLAHAHAHVPYYRRLLDDAGLSPAEAATGDGFRSLPRLSKPLIQEHFDALISEQSTPQERVLNHTGGSTGAALDFYQDQTQRDWGTANKLRCNRWAGWDFGTPTLRLWGSPQDLQSYQSAKGKLRAWVLGEATFDAFGFSEADLARLAEQMRHTRPPIVVAYASMMSHFTAYLEEQAIDDLPAPRAIITSTDMLLPHQRTQIERVLRAPVFNRYGCREVSVVAAECEQHRLHLNADRLLVEIVDDAGQPTAPGEMGRVVITDLFNRAMPFIRYDIGDMAIASDEVCACGRGLPVIAELVGRYADILRTPEGRFVSASALTTQLHQVPGLRESQLVQTARDRLRVNAVRRDGYTDESEQIFRQRLHRFFGPTMQIDFRYVEQLPRTPSGKVRFSVSQIGEG